MSAKVVDGNIIADIVKKRVAHYITLRNHKPSLSVILVGQDAASEIYIKNKEKACREVGIHSQVHRFHKDVMQKDVENFIKKLESDGILVQLPLPLHFDKFSVLNSVPFEKDVDCFNDKSIGRIAQGTNGIKPCTPSAILEILRYYDVKTKGKRVTIINRSQVVGQPLSIILSQDPWNATVTVCHEHTENLFFHTLNSDIIITAVGKSPSFHLPPFAIMCGAVVIDVAMNRVNGKIFGDVADFEGAKERASLITPVPGGVGLVTVAYLMENTLTLAKLRNGLL